MRLLILVMCLTLGGCASVDIQKVTDSNRDTVHGIRYWRPAPYLAITAQPDKTCIAKIMYLPDSSEEYVMTPTGGFGSVTFKPTLTDGWNLTALDTNIDSKASDVLGVLTKMLGMPSKEPKAQGKPTEVPIYPGLYRMVMDRATGAIKLDQTEVYRAGVPCGEFGGETLSPKPNAN